MLAHIIGEVGTFCTVLLVISSRTCLPIFVESDSYLTNTEQKISWHNFFETRCRIQVTSYKTVQLIRTQYNICKHLTLAAASPGIFKTPIIIFNTESISNEFDDIMISSLRKKTSNCVRMAGHAGDEFSSTIQSRYVARLTSKLLNSSFDTIFMSFTPCSHTHHSLSAAFINNEKHSPLTKT